MCIYLFFGTQRKVDSRCFFFSSRRRHTRSKRDWSSDVCSSDLEDGSGCWPSAATIARKANISDCTVRREIARRKMTVTCSYTVAADGPGTNSYTVVTDDRVSTTPDAVSPLTICPALSPDPPGNHYGTAAPCRLVGGVPSRKMAPPSFGSWRRSRRRGDRAVIRV